MEYTFRVCAENMAGNGKFSKASESIVCRDKVDSPGRPDVVEVGRNTAVLEWKKPDYNGGARITGMSSFLSEFEILLN